MLVTLNDVLLDAKKNKYAVGLFNTVDLEMAKGVLNAAEELRSPVIIGSAECCFAIPDLKISQICFSPWLKKPQFRLFFILTTDLQRKISKNRSHSDFLRSCTTARLFPLKKMLRLSARSRIIPMPAA